MGIHCGKKSYLDMKRWIAPCGNRGGRAGIENCCGIPLGIDSDSFEVFTLEPGRYPLRKERAVRELLDGAQDSLLAKLLVRARTAGLQAAAGARVDDELGQ